MSEHETGGAQHLADHVTKGKSWCEIVELIRGQMTVSISNKGNEHRLKKRMGDEVLAASTSHEAGRARVVRELNVARGVRQALGNRSAIEILEACSCMKSDTRLL